MQSEDRTQRLRRWYAKLLCLYPRSFYDRFGEGMEQTFNDLLHERHKAGRRFLGFVVWAFCDTLASIIGEHMTSLTIQGVSKKQLICSFLVAILLITPLTAMQLAAQVSWDFWRIGFMGILLIGSWIAYDFLSRQSAATGYKSGVAVSVFALLNLIWVTGTVGILGDQTNANLMYCVVILTGFVGSVLARCKAQGMAWTMLAMALVQILVPLTALTVLQAESSPEQQFFGSPGLAGVIVVSGFFVTLFVVSAILFWRTERITSV